MVLLRRLWLKYETKALSLIPPLLLIYIFFQPFNHFAGIRNTAFVLMLVLFLIKAVRGGIDINWKDSTVIVLLIFLSTILISILFSNYSGESLNAFRKNFFYQLVAFFVILTEFRDRNRLESLFYCIIISFATLTIIIFIRNPIADLLNSINELKESRDTFLSGYAINAAFYMPFAISYLLCSRNKIMLKLLLWTAVAAEFVLVWLYYNSRTSIMAIVLATIFMLIISRKYLILMLILMVIISVGAVSYLKKPELFNRYATLASVKTFTTNEGLSGRLDIWKGMIDIIKERPFIGYGYGWKKLATVAKDEEFLDNWRNELPGTYNYFKSAGYGSANPHNLILQIIFEIGILGLIAFFMFWITLVVKIVRLYFIEVKYGVDFAKYGIPGILISYAMLNITNGLWEETYGVLTFTLAAIIIVIYEKNTEGKYKENTPNPTR